MKWGSFQLKFSVKIFRKVFSVNNTFLLLHHCNPSPFPSIVGGGKKVKIENENFFILEDSVAVLSELKLAGML